jgi:hypothetical protein
MAQVLEKVCAVVSSRPVDRKRSGSAHGDEVRGLAGIARSRSALHGGERSDCGAAQGACDVL